jgi:hypothetical protein
MRHHDGFPQIATGPIASSHIRVLKNGASGRDPALRGFCNCSHIFEYVALFNRPRAQADGPMLVFEHPADRVFLHAEIFAFTASWRYFISIGPI